MNRFSKLLLIPAAVIAIAGGVGIAAATNGSSGDDPATPTTVDVKGPCDELEHATDPRCDGVLVPEDNEADDPVGDNDNGQADDQNDDNGQADDQNDDNGQDDQGEVEDQDDDQGEDVDDQGENQDDNSGPSANSGPGSSHDDGDDISGHSDDDDSGSDDGGHSGPGGGDGEDD